MLRYGPTHQTCMYIGVRHSLYDSLPCSVNLPVLQATLYLVYSDIWPCFCVWLGAVDHLTARACGIHTGGIQTDLPVLFRTEKRYTLQEYQEHNTCQEPCDWPAWHSVYFCHKNAMHTWSYLRCLLIAFTWFCRCLSQNEGIHILFYHSTCSEDVTTEPAKLFIISTCRS